MLVDSDPRLEDGFALLTAADVTDLVGITTVDDNVGIKHTARADGAANSVLLGLIDVAVTAGWTHSRVCMVLYMNRRRAWRCTQRRVDRTLDEARPWGHPIHRLLGSERDEIVRLLDEWDDIGSSHRKLAHRGSYLPRVWVSLATVDGVLTGQDLA